MLLGTAWFYSLTTSEDIIDVDLTENVYKAIFIIADVDHVLGAIHKHYKYALRGA